MNFSKAKDWAAAASGIVLGLSALHVVCASIYLYFYCVGFGANISMFFSAPDIFSISITKLAGVYIRSLLWPVTIYSIFLLFRIKTNQEWIASAPSPASSERRRRNMAFALKASAATVTLALVITLWAAVGKWLNGEPFSTYAVLSNISLLMMFVIIRWKGHTPIWLGLGLFFLSGVVGGALDNGQSDRHIAYSSSRSLPTCNGFKVLAKASSHYVAVGNQGTKVLVKEDCKVAFVFPKPKPR